MHVTDLAVNQWLGIGLAPEGSSHQLELPDNPGLHNYVGTVHASVLFALAEACSGEFLIQQLSERHAETFAVLRTSSTKFRKPGLGMLKAQARFQSTEPPPLLHDLDTRGRTIVAIDVEVIDSAQTVVMTGQFDWFLQRQHAE